MDAECTAHHTGTALKTKRESMGITLETVSQHLKLSAHTLLQLENANFSHLPPAFLKGYLKSYAKYLDFSDNDIQLFLHSVHGTELTRPILPLRPLYSASNKTQHLFMPIFSLFLMAAVIALFSLWWYNHPPLPSSEDVALTIRPNSSESSARLFLSTLDALQHPKKNFTELPVLAKNEEDDDEDEA